jgi:tRNA (guanine10-N2)-dimethyltransferase
LSENLAKNADAIVIASGWQPSIARAEFSALVDSTNTLQFIHERVLICDQDSATKIAHRSALISETLYPASHSLYTDLEKHVELVISWCKEHLENTGQTLAVRANKIGKKVEGWSTRSIEQTIGGALFRDGWKIDLTAPEITLKITALNHNNLTEEEEGENPSQIIWGVKSSGTSTWDERTAPKRPYFKPISLDPRLARAMANIACPEEGKILDPFCGTGGILLEAAAIGSQVFGSDADSRMVEGSRDNLKWAKEIQTMSQSAKIKRGLATQLTSLWQEYMPFDGFAFDPPYGLNSWKSDDGWQLFIGALSSCGEVATPNAQLAALLPWPPKALGMDLLRDDFGQGENDGLAQTFGKSWVEVVKEVNAAGWQIESTTTIPVHKSLARLLLVCQRMN